MSLKQYQSFLRTDFAEISAFNFDPQKKVVLISGKSLADKVAPAEMFFELFNSKSKKLIKRAKLSNGFTSTKNPVYQTYFKGSQNSMLIAGPRMFVCDLSKGFKISRHITPIRSAIECIAAIQTKETILCGGFFKGIYELSLKGQKIKTNHFAKDYSNATSIIAVERRSIALISFEEPSHGTEIVCLQLHTFEVISKICIKYCLAFLNLSMNDLDSIIFKYKNRARFTSSQSDSQGFGMLNLDGDRIQNNSLNLLHLDDTEIDNACRIKYRCPDYYLFFTENKVRLSKSSENSFSSKFFEIMK